MLKFITRVFALIGFIVAAAIVALAAIGAHMQNHAQPEPASVILSLDFTQPIVEQNEPSPLDLAMSGESTALIDILHAIEAAKSDPHVKGIVARFGSHQPSLTQAQEIRTSLARFRASGKFTYAFGTDFGEYGMGDRSYFLASAFENIWLQPVGTVSLTGIAIQSPFGKTALDKIGVTADFMQREEYKSFMEPGQRDNFSPPVKAEMQALLDNLSNQIAGGIAESRKWDIDHVKDLMKRGPFTDEEAMQEGLVTKLAYADEVDEEMDRKAGKDAKQLDVETYLSYADGGASDPKKEVTVALIYGTGLITEQGGGNSLAGEHIMGADQIAEAFADAADDKNVKAILFRIDSPGGSPAASETIRRAMIHAQKKGKPVVVSMGDTAASGGYWIAMNGDRIIADPATLTGSIGVVAGKFADNGLLQKIGVSIDSITTTDNAGMWNMMAGFNPVQRARVNALLDNTYHSFVGNVATARKIPVEKMPDLAKGRVWTGDQAVKNGLVDELGGYEVSYLALRKILKVEDSKILSLETFPAALTPTERLMKLLHHFGAEGALASVSLQKISTLQTALRPFLSAMTPTGVVSARINLGEAVHD